MRRGRLLWRIHRRTREPLHFRRSGANRFDDPARAFGVCYLGLSARAAFAETFLRRPGATLLDWLDLRARSVSVFRVTSTLRLASLYGPGLARVGATAGVTHGAHEIAQAWSAAIHDHPARPDGIAYRARHDDERCAALFERTTTPFECVSTTPLEDLKVLGELLDRYAIGIVGGPE